MTAPPPPGPLRRFDRLLATLTFVLGGLLLAFMAGFGTFNVVVMRKLANAPIRGAEDLIVLALVLAVALAVPFGARAGAHVEIELLDDMLSARAGRISRGAMRVVGAALMGALAWCLWHAGGQAARFGEASQTLVISYGPFYRMLAAGSALCAVIFLIEAVLMTRGRPTPPLQFEDAP